MINKADLQSIFSEIFFLKKSSNSTPATTVSKIIESQPSKNLSDLLEDQLVLSVLNKQKSPATKNNNNEKKNINIIPTIEINFFNTSPSSCYYFVITSTVSNFEKSTAVSMIAYLFVIFLVFTTCLIVPI